MCSLAWLVTHSLAQVSFELVTVLLPQPFKSLCNIFKWAYISSTHHMKLDVEFSTCGIMLTLKCLGLSNISDQGIGNYLANSLVFHNARQC